MIRERFGLKLVFVLFWWVMKRLPTVFCCMTLRRSVAQKRGRWAAPEGGEEGGTQRDVDRDHG